MVNRNTLKDRVGTVGVNNWGSKMVVVEYNRNDDMFVRFEKGKPIHAEWKDFCKGNVRSPYDKTIFGIGYLGEGNYKTWENDIKKLTPQYNCWSSMIQRCYDNKLHIKYPSYVDCKVSDEWHNFQTFAKWYDDNFYQVKNEKMQLDKDILIKSNKIYSSDTCIFVPQQINKLFKTSNHAKRRNLPMGVIFNKEYNKYTAFCSEEGKKYYLGAYDTLEEAFLQYKTFKEKVIKKLAIKYRDQIPIKLYDAMIDYRIEYAD